MTSEQIFARLQEALEKTFCPVGGCWGLHGAKLECFYDPNMESHVLEAWPHAFNEDQPEGNGHKAGALYELAEFDFTTLLEEIDLESFHFSQMRQVFEISWHEGDKLLELRLHIEPHKDDEG
jgi:hypothetical protein